MELKLKSPEKIAVSYEGATYMVAKPKVSQVFEFEKKTKEGDGAESLVGFLEALGLPRSVVLDLTAEGLEELVSVLMPSKKK